MDVFFFFSVLKLESAGYKLILNTKCDVDVDVDSSDAGQGCNIKSCPFAAYCVQFFLIGFE
jgi:hypothetical protein